jgi:hypothetical protein
MKITRTLILTAFVIAVFSSYGYSQTKPAASTCDWDIALAPAQGMSSTKAEWILPDGGVAVTCTDSLEKTDDDAKAALVKGMINSLKEQAGDAKVTSEGPIAIGNFRGTTYSITAGSILVELRLVTRGKTAYILVVMAKTDANLKRLRKVLDSFTINN